MKTIFRFLAIISIGLGIFFYQNGMPKNFPFTNQTGQAIDSQNQAANSNTKVLGDSASVKEVSLSDPLKVAGEWLSSDNLITKLTNSGVAEYANKERNRESLSALSMNEKLNASAKIKLDDMTDKRYFEHTSPEGITISDLANEAGYDFIMIGENLAVGDFRDDSALVSAWMESTTHRDNILNSRYTEIGVAVGRVMKDGKETWLAVTHFGRPSNLCPDIDKNLKSAIDQNKARIDTLSEELNLAGGEAAALLAYVTDFSKVREYNKLIIDTTADINLYNKQVSEFNNCIQN